MKLVGSVGAAGNNFAPDVYLVQLALSEVSLPSASNAQNGALWPRGNVSGKHAGKLTEAIRTYQTSRKLKATGKIEPKSPTLKKLVTEVPRVRGKVATRFGVVSEQNLRNIARNGEIENQRILLKAPLLNKEAKALAKFVLQAGKEGLELIWHETSIHRQHGRFYCRLILHSERYTAFWEELALKAYKALMWRATSGAWIDFSNNPFFLMSRSAYDFLRPKNYKMGDGALGDYKLSRAEYNTNPIIQTVADAFTRIQFESEGKNPRASYSDRAKLLSVLYPIKPNAARLMMALTTNEGKLSEVRELYPLYAAGFEVGGPLLKFFGAGFKAQIILNPNTKKEYLYFELTSSIGEQKWNLDAKFERLNKSMTDFTSGGAEISGKTSGAFRLGNFEIKVTLHAKPIKKADPEFLGELKVDGKGSGASGLIFKWDIGLLEITIEAHTENKSKAELAETMAIAMKQHLLFDFDADFWDELLYLMVDDVDDLHRIGFSK